MSSDEGRTALTEFARFARSLKGGEKSEAQLSLDKFFRALAAKEIADGKIISPGFAFPNTEPQRFHNRR